MQVQQIDNYVAWICQRCKRGIYTKSSLGKPKEHECKHCRAKYLLNVQEEIKLLRDKNISISITTEDKFSAVDQIKEPKWTFWRQTLGSILGFVSGISLIGGLILLGEDDPVTVLFFFIVAISAGMLLRSRYRHWLEVDKDKKRQEIEERIRQDKEERERKDREHSAREFSKIRQQIEQKRICKLEEEAKRKAEAEKREERKRRQELEYLLSLDSYEFEKVVVELYRDLGYDVTHTPPQNDGGFDARAVKDGECYLIECKRWSETRIGRPGVQKLGGCHAGREMSARSIRDHQ